MENKQPEQRFKSAKSKLYNAWISPSGQIIEVDPGYHYNYVIDMLEEKYGKEYLLNMKMTSNRQIYKYMEDQGWIRITNWSEGQFSFVFPKKIRIPQCQKKAVAIICIDNNIPIPFEIRE